MAHHSTKSLWNYSFHNEYTFITIAKLLYLGFPFFKKKSKSSIFTRIKKINSYTSYIWLWVCMWVWRNSEKECVAISGCCTIFLRYNHRCQKFASKLTTIGTYKALIISKVCGPVKCLFFNANKLWLILTNEYCPLEGNLAIFQQKGFCGLLEETLVSILYTPTLVIIS